MPSLTLGYCASAETQLVANLQAATAGFDFRTTSPLVNVGTAGSSLDLTTSANPPTHSPGVGYVFDGTNDLLTEADNSLLDFAAGEVGTVYFSFTPTILGVACQPVGKRNTLSTSAGTSAGWQLCQNTGNAIFLRVNDGTNASVSSTTTSTISSGTRYSVAGRIGASTIQVYLDGVAAGSTAVSRPAGGTLANALPLNVGTVTGVVGPFGGTIHQIIVFRAEHTAAEILAISNLLKNPV